MSSNVGLSTPRGSGTSGYVQRNMSYLKPRNAGYGAPYPPISSSTSSPGAGGGFKQRKPDQQILEHDRKRAIEVKVLEERERLEEENERFEDEGQGDKVLSDEEIDERCDALRQKLLKELEDYQEGSEGRHDRTGPGPDRVGGGRDRGRNGSGDGGSGPYKERRQYKSYQVHELAEAKLEETERLRKALGIKEDWEREKDGASDRKDKDGARDRRTSRE